MTTLDATRPVGEANGRGEGRGNGNGGVAARRAVVRWSWRLFRREWRQQLVVLTLLTFSTTTALFAAIAVYHMQDSSDSTFGRARHRITLVGADPSATTAAVQDLTGRFGPVEVIGHSTVPIPGSVESFDFRTQQANGPFSAPMLRLRRGHYPISTSDVAITDGVASAFGLSIGDTSSFVGATRTVVGLVENPANLDDEFILADPTAITAPPSVTLLVDGHDGELGHRAGTARQLPGIDSSVSAVAETRDDARRGAAAVLVLALDTVALLLVSLVAGAAFVAVAQRRLRQLGMLAAVGATHRHLRLVMVAHGLAVSAAAAVAGTIAALAAWLSAGARLEPLAHHRIDRTDIPWWVVIITAVLAMLTTTTAAWWPARKVARVPIVRALSGRPPAPTRVHRSSAAAALFLTIGAVALVVGIDKAGHVIPVAIIAGPIAIVLGILFLCPLAIRLAAASVHHLPIAMRLALRDLARHQARASAALAAISLGLGIAFTAIIVTAASTPLASAGNLSDRQLLVHIGRNRDQSIIPEQTPAELAQLEASITRFAATLDGAVVYPLDAAVASHARAEPTAAARVGRDPFGQPGRQAILVGERVSNGIRVTSGGFPYVATPELLARIGIDPASIDASIEVISPKMADFALIDPSTFTRAAIETRSARVRVIHDPGYADAPNTFITEAALRDNGWTSMPGGWFIESKHRLTARQRAEARQLAARSGLTVVTRNEHRELAVTRTAAAAAGSLLALGILAMTIGLIRGEATRDLQTLTATGATSHARRALTAATAGALALLGAAIGLTGAYVALIAGYSDKLRPLTRVPLLHLVVILVGLPVVAAVAGWLLAGREPRAFARQSLD